jgi:regulatory protein
VNHAFSIVEAAVTEAKALDAEADEGLFGPEALRAARAMGAPKPANRELVSAALRLLARRDMSRKEFTTKISKGEFSTDEIESVTAWCAAEGFLNEARYAEGKARVLGNRYGARRVGATLKQKGVVDELVETAVTALKETDFARAREMWLRKFGEPAADQNSRNKQVRYLQSRGFGFDVIKRVIKGEAAEE